MAPPNGHDNGRPHANVPKAAPARIVPAIPRQLTKPRPAKSLVNGDKREAETSASKEEVKGPVPERRDVPQSDVPGNTTDLHGDTVKSSAVGTASEGLTRSETLEQDATGAANGQRETQQGLEDFFKGELTGYIEQPASKATTSELPPPFFPSKLQTSFPSSARPSAELQPVPQLIAHRAHPSAGSIVFGGAADSSTPSPAPPQSAGSMYGPPPLPAQPFSPNGSMNGGASAFVHSAHSHQLSGPPPARAYPYPPHFNSQPDAYYPPQQPAWNPLPGPPANGAMPFRPGPSINDLVNASRPASQSSSIPSDTRENITHTPSSVNASNDGRMNARNPVMGFAGKQTPPIPGTMSSGIESDPSTPYPLRNFLLGQFGNPELADYILELTTPLPYPLTIPVHSLLLARSPALLALMRISRYQDSNLPTPRRLTLPISFVWRDPNATILALEHLYGGPLLEPGLLMQNVPSPEPESFSAISDGKRRLDGAMTYTLSYIAAGIQLQISAIVARGMDVASRLLAWGTIETALAFATTNTAPSDGQNRAGTPNGRERPTYDPYASQLMHQIVNFIAHNTPSDFRFDASAPQLGGPNRIASPPPQDRGHGQRSSLSMQNPKLMSIRFGDIGAVGPLDYANGLDGGRSAGMREKDTLISSVLLSLPSDASRSLLAQPRLAQILGQEAVNRLTEAVGTERQRREAGIGV